jgi:hypothetical protein
MNAMFATKQMPQRQSRLVGIEHRCADRFGNVGGTF